MIRMVATPEGVVPDFQGRAPGRGAYLHPRDECIKRLVNSKVKEFKSLRKTIAREDRVRIAGAITERLDRESTVE